MRSPWTWLHTRPTWQRWTSKTSLMVGVIFLALYPYPHFFIRNVDHFNHLNTLPDPAGDELQPIQNRLESYLVAQQIDPNDPDQLLPAVQAFVYDEIPYGWDWDVWGVVDYLPTLAEVLERKTEDCDGQAIVAAALLRGRGIPADLVGDPRHIWVHTPTADTMNPLGDPVVTSDEDGVRVDWLRLIDTQAFTFGVSVFPVFRELIIALALWMMLLARHPHWKRASLGLFFLLTCLLLWRMAGQIHGLELTGGQLRGKTDTPWSVYFIWSLVCLILGVNCSGKKSRIAI